jgi:hypothetical protein
MSFDIERSFLQMVTDPLAVGELASDGLKAAQVDRAAADPDLLFVAGTLLDGQIISSEMAEYCGILCAEVSESYGLTVEETDQALRIGKTTVLKREV